MNQSSHSLQGLSILIVEDNFLIASALERTLKSWGCKVIGPTPSVEEAERLVDNQDLAGAILDINIRGGTSASVAQRLRSRGLPFIFITGYSSPHQLPKELLEAQRLHKPLTDSVLHLALLNKFVDQ